MLCFWRYIWNTHKMVCGKETVMRDCGRSSLLHTVVNQKRKISDSRALASYKECWHMPYSFELCVMKRKKEKGRKKERRTKRVFLWTIFSTLRKVSGILGALSTIQQWRVLFVNAMQPSAFVIVKLLLYLKYRRPLWTCPPSLCRNWAGPFTSSHVQPRLANVLY